MIFWANVKPFDIIFTFWLMLLPICLMLFYILADVIANLFYVIFMADVIAIFG